jgi:type I restriction enzyme R subunit
VGQQQAKLYADCLEASTGSARDLLLQRLRALDLGRHGLSAARGAGLLQEGRTELLIQRRSSRKPLAGTADQRRHHRALLPDARRAPHRRSFEVDNQRKALVVMATGAGKTRTVIALATC